MKVQLVILASHYPYIYMCIRTYVDGWIDGWMMDRWIDGWIDG